MTLPDSPTPSAEAHEASHIARAASVIALGNITSRVLGLARETVKSHFFGAGSAVDAYGVATIVPVMLYDLLIGGMVNGALVPVFSAYVTHNRRDLWGLANALLNLTVVLLAAAVLVIDLLAAPIATLLLSGHSAATLALAVRLMRVTVPAVLFLSLSGVLSALLYALRRFTLPAFTAAVFNAGIVVVTLLLHRQLGIGAMALGLLIGATAQVILQLPGLRGTGFRYDLRLMHPGLYQVARLYAPSLIPLAVDVLISRPVSYALASQAGEGSISWMIYATNLTQLPQGLVATAISLAVLPTLSAHAANERLGRQEDAFRRTLAQGLRLVTVLIIPASVGLFILARPVVALLYEHGDFLALDTAMTAWALRFYLLGLPFAALDLLLVFAFYARQDTVTPALIGVGTILAYLLLAAGLLPTWGLFALMIADSFKHLLHTLISALILGRRIAGWGGLSIPRTAGIVALASAVMGLATYGSLRGVEVLFPSSSVLGEVLAVAVPGLLGASVYTGLAALCGLGELRLLWASLRRRFATASATDPHAAPRS